MIWGVAVEKVRDRKCLFGGDVTRNHRVHGSDVPNVVGRHARTTAGLAPVGMSGTHSIPEACAPPASIVGLRPSASSVAAGRRIRSGTRSDSPSNRYDHVSRFRRMLDQFMGTCYETHGFSDHSRLAHHPLRVKALSSNPVDRHRTAWCRVFNIYSA